MTDKNKKVKVIDAVIVSDDETINFVDATVKNEVVKFEIADAEIAKLIDRASGLTIKSLEDLEVYEEIKSLHKEFVSTRTAIDKKRKEINKPFDDVIKGVNAKGAEFTKRLAPSELALATEKNKFEALQKAEDERLEKEAEKKLNERVEELKISGMFFNPESGLYEYGEDISLDIVTIKKLSDFDFTAVNEKIKIAKKKNDDKMEADRLQKEEEDRLQKEIAKKNEDDRLEIRAEKLELRSGKLLDLGFIEDITLDRFAYSGNGKSIFLTFDQIAEMSAGDFKDTVGNYSKIIETAKEEARLKKIEDDNSAEKLKRATSLRSLNLTKIDTGNYFYEGVEVLKSAEVADLTIDFQPIYLELVKKIAEIDKKNQEKADADAKIKADAIEKSKKEALPDLEKIERYLIEIQAIEVPKMKTPAGVSLMESVSETLRKFIDSYNELLKKASK